MRLLGLLLLPCAACDPARGSWIGHCALPGAADADVNGLKLDLEGTDQDGLGSGTGRTVESDGSRRGDVLFVLTDFTFALDLYLPQGDLLLLRGEVDDQGKATGTCGSPKVEELVGLEDLFDDCVLEVDPGCDTHRRWKPDGIELAPVKRRELHGDFVLRHE